MGYIVKNIVLIVSFIWSIWDTRSQKYSCMETRSCRYSSPISFIRSICFSTQRNISWWSFNKGKNIIYNIIIPSNFSHQFSRRIIANGCSKPRSTNSESIRDTNADTFNKHNFITNSDQVSSKEWCNSSKFY